MDKNSESDSRQDAAAHPDNEHASPPLASPLPPLRARTRGATGPRTSAGKAVSSRNAVGFGFFAKNLFLTKSAKREYSHLLRDLLAEWQPVGPTEILQLEILAWFAFQLRRVLRVREALIAQKSLSATTQNPVDPATQHKDGENEKELTGALKELRNHMERQEQRMRDQDFVGKVFQELVCPGGNYQLERAENHFLRHLYRAMAELERLKRIRLGQSVIPPLMVHVERT